ncbi:hypothetical protein [Cyanobium sp. ATX-6F1]|uniref:hypothetical protein n=1 Tax=Cyanobium sp. ATX-6F1 TaxID=3137388 RepID=UPI0039BEB263
MAWLGHPSWGLTRSVRPKPSWAMRVGMWVIESIRFTWRPVARLMQAWKSGSRTEPSRLLQSARLLPAPGPLPLPKLPSPSAPKASTRVTWGSSAQIAAEAVGQTTCTWAWS